MKLFSIIWKKAWWNHRNLSRLGWQNLCGNQRICIYVSPAMASLWSSRYWTDWMLHQKENVNWWPADRWVLYPVKVTLKKIKISLYGLIAEVLRGEVVSFAGNLDCVEVFNTLLNQIFQFCQSLRMWMMRHPDVLKIAPIVLNYCVISRSASAQRDCAYYCCWLNSYWSLLRYRQRHDRYESLVRRSQPA